jgi:two-component system, chemotaxis family, protein-glutamate methylesterase/glutaminase
MRKGSLLKHEPDVMICDIQMPKMNGIDFVKKLMPQYPLPVIVVSTLSDAVFDALNAGAVEFIQKPDVRSTGSVGDFLDELTRKVIIASRAKVRSLPKAAAGSISSGNTGSKFKLIAIGASTGGTEAIFSLLMRMPADMPGIVIVQHIPPIFSKMFSERLNVQTKLRVSEAQSGDVIEPGRVLIAPGDQHMVVKRIGNILKVECYKGQRVGGHCPSVDVMFSSVAEKIRSEAIGVILTGMGQDGARGLLEMRAAGARTIGQDENSCVVYGMPKVAYDMGGVEVQSDLLRIPDVISTIIKRSG